MGEFDLIERIRRRSPAGSSVLVGIGDDAAVVSPTPGQALAATTDSVVLDRHFTAAWPAADIGHLALQINLSDLAAMGARPRWALLALTLPEDDVAWLDGFLDGFLAVAEQHGVELIGGNIAGGPLNICVQLLGEIDPELIARRIGARSGDLLAVTGTLGDAAAALALGDLADAALVRRLRRPCARVGAGQVLVRHVHAMMDLSDGLIADLSHLLGSGVGADVRLDQLPASPALAAAFADRRQRWRYQAGGGSDYELLVALPADAGRRLDDLAEDAGVAVSVIGQFTDSGRLRCLDDAGEEIADLPSGWDHFGND